MGRCSKRDAVAPWVIFRAGMWNSARRSSLPSLLVSAGLSVALAAACGHDWDAYDPRLTGGASSGTGGDAGATYRDIVLGDAPIAYYRFEETQGTAIADEVQQYPGVATGAVLGVA